MRLRKTLLRFTFTFMISLILIVFVYFLSACVLSVIPVNKNFRNATNGITFYIRSNGVHTDFVLPVETKIIDWKSKIPFTDFSQVDSSFRWIAFGWGNREFYLETREWSNLKISTAVKAGIGIGDCAMHVEYIYKPMNNWLKLVIEEQKYSDLVSYISSWFKTDSAQNYIHIPNSGYYSNDTFYEAHGTYTIFHTCNEWTASVLRAVGIRMGIWSPFEMSVMYHLRSIK
jgi:uncharacterized protein (TIGR02117 family)